MILFVVLKSAYFGASDNAPVCASLYRFNCQKLIVRCLSPTHEHMPTVESLVKHKNRKCIFDILCIFTISANAEKHDALHIMSEYIRTHGVVSVLKQFLQCGKLIFHILLVCRNCSNIDRGRNNKFRLKICLNGSWRWRRTWEPHLGSPWLDQSDMFHHPMERQPLGLEEDRSTPWQLCPGYWRCRGGGVTRPYISTWVWVAE